MFETKIAICADNDRSSPHIAGCNFSTDDFSVVRIKADIFAQRNEATKATFTAPSESECYYCHRQLTIHFTHPESRWAAK